MATRTIKRSGKKFRKVGRGLRKPSQIRYNAERRWERNKNRRIARNADKAATKE